MNKRHSSWGGDGWQGVVGRLKNSMPANEPDTWEIIEDQRTVLQDKLKQYRAQYRENIDDKSRLIQCAILAVLLKGGKVDPLVPYEIMDEMNAPIKTDWIDRISVVTAKTLDVFQQRGYVQRSKKEPKTADKGESAA